MSYEKNFSDLVVVSVICLTYNHEEYIERCLDGFVSQKTNFRFEVFVHDDASTDRTASIVKKYEKKYSDIIRGIYQTENQYSKGISIARNFIWPIARGKYFAFCEGDDYWCDSRKLQKQYDFLESHPGYSACFHCTLVNHLDNPQGNYVTPNISESREITCNEAICGGANVFRTSSFFVLREIVTERPLCFKVKGVGDLPIVMFAAISGKVYCFKDVMSVYNRSVNNSWTTQFKNNLALRIAHLEDKIRMLKSVDQYYGYKFHKPISKTIRKNEYYLTRAEPKRLFRSHYFFVFLSFEVAKFIKNPLSFLLRVMKKILKSH